MTRVSEARRSLDIDNTEIFQLTTSKENKYVDLQLKYNKFMEL